MNAWVSYTNANGGINGHKLKLIVVDDKSTPPSGLQAAQQLINDHVLAIVGGQSGTAESWATTVQQAGIPVIGGGPNEPPWGVNPDFFPAGTTGIQAVELGFKAVIQKGAPALGLAYLAGVPATEAAVGLFKAAAQATGGSVASAQGVAPGAPSFTAQCLDFKNAKATSGQLILTPADNLAFAEACAQQGWKPVYMGLSNEILPYWATNPVFNNFGGLIQNFPWFSNSSLANTFNAAMKQYDPQDATTDQVGGTMAWAAGELFKAAAVKANLGDSPASAQLVGALTTMVNETAGGASPPLTFTNGNRLVKCGWIISSASGSFTLPNGDTTTCVS
jgi:branched-chain amino acid transport system substrate-binding protein